MRRLLVAALLVGACGGGEPEGDDDGGSCAALAAGERILVMTPGRIWRVAVADGRGELVGRVVTAAGAVADSRDFVIGGGRIVVLGAGALYQGAWPPAGADVLVEAVALAPPLPGSLQALAGTPAALLAAGPQGIVRVEIATGSVREVAALALPVGCERVEELLESPFGVDLDGPFALLLGCSSGAPNQLLDVDPQAEEPAEPSAVAFMAPIRAWIVARGIRLTDDGVSAPMTYQPLRVCDAGTHDRLPGPIVAARAEATPAPAPLPSPTLPPTGGTS